MLQLFNDKVRSVYDKVHSKYIGTDNESRFRHIEGVCEMATFLAKKYNANVESAQIAALVHDYYKYESNEYLEQIINKEDIEECRKYNVLYHSYSSACALKNEFNIDDIDIYNAVRNHVFGHTNMTMLEKIILIADYTEYGREYDDCKACREILLNKGINEAIYYSTERVVEFLEKRGIKPHPMQYEILEKYKEFK